MHEKQNHTNCVKCELTVSIDNILECSHPQTSSALRELSCSEFARTLGKELGSPFLDGTYLDSFIAFA